MRVAPPAWLIAGSVAIGALVAGCGGGGHSAVPAAPALVQSAPAGATRSGTLAVKIQLPVGGTLTKTSVKRSPQYVSGLTQGVYIAGTCLTGGGTVTQSCTGASFPAVYADVSAASPLCSGTPRTCTLSASPVAGFSYAVTVAAVDTAPIGEVNGYGTAFPSTATELSVGSNPVPMPAATGSPGPAPTPTALGAFVGRGSANSLSIGLNPIATQFIQVNPDNGAATDNVIPATATGTNYDFSIFFSAGDAAGNLIAPPPTCMNTYAGEVGSGGGATIANPFFPSTTVGATGCDSFAGPDGKSYAPSVTSTLPTHVCSVPQTPGPCSSGTSASVYEAGNFPPLSVLLGVWTQAPLGVLNVNPGLQWDGIADNDTACTPSCGVPIALTLSNNIPATVTPIVGKTSSYNVTNVNQFYLAPFVTTLACGTNTACAGTTTASNCTGFCAQLALNNGGTAKAKVFLYAAGGSANLAGGTGCYTSSCFNIAVNGNPPANISSCYTGLNQYTGQSSGTAACNDVADPAAGTSLPAGTVDCKSPSNAPNPGTTIALIEPGAFQKGALAPPGVADTMAFVVQAVAGPTTGFCNFQIVDPNRTPAAYSLPILVQVTTTGTVIVVPPNQPFPTAPVMMQVFIPANAASASATSYVSPATRSVSVLYSGQSTQTFTVGSGANGCAVNVSVIVCQLPVRIPSNAPSPPRVLAYASTNGTGSPLAISTSTASNSSTTFTPQWTPVVSAMSSSIGTFAAGVAASVPFALTIADAAGSAIPAGTSSFADASGAPITITLSDSDTSGETSLGTTVFSGNQVLFGYNGNLPLVTGITVGATATTTSSTVATTSSAVTAPTASHNFTFSVGTASQTPQTSVLASWFYIPDSKMSIVNEGGTYRMFWPLGGGGAAPTGVLSSTGTGPLPENQTGSAVSVYNPSQTWESNGAWFMNIFPYNQPYAATDTNDLVAIYHAESNNYTYYNKASGISYSSDGGRSWSAGQLAITAYNFPNMLPGLAPSGDDAADLAAIYDPVNRRWVAFYTAADECPGFVTSGLTIAMSADARATTGTWFKYYNGSFSQPGIGGCETPIPNFTGIGFTSNADVSWNSYLNEWIMLMNGSNPNTSIYLSTSTDLYTWTPPQLVTSGTDILPVNGTAAYPTLIGAHDEKITGQSSTLFYAFRDATVNQGFRIMYERMLNFHRND